MSFRDESWAAVDPFGKVVRKTNVVPTKLGWGERLSFKQWIRVDEKVGVRISAVFGEARGYADNLDLLPNPTYSLFVVGSNIPDVMRVIDILKKELGIVKIQPDLLLRLPELPTVFLRIKFLGRWLLGR